MVGVLLLPGRFYFLNFLPTWFSLLEAKREQISKLLESIEERLQTLENETKELKEYQKWDRDRRALEYTIYDRELKETRKKLEDVQSRREQSSESTAEIRRAAKETLDKIEVSSLS